MLCLYRKAARTDYLRVCWFVRMNTVLEAKIADFVLHKLERLCRTFFVSFTGCFPLRNLLLSSVGSVRDLE